MAGNTGDRHYCEDVDLLELERLLLKPAEHKRVTAHCESDLLLFNWYIGYDVVKFATSAFEYARLTHEMIAFRLLRMYRFGLVFPTTVNYEITDELCSYFPGLCKLVQLPGAHSHSPIYSIVLRLNDHMGWTREEIADWLDTLDVDLTCTSLQSGLPAGTKNAMLDI